MASPQKRVGEVRESQHHSLRTINELQDSFARFTQKKHILLVRGCWAAPAGEPSLALCDGLGGGRGGQPPPHLGKAHDPHLLGLENVGSVGSNSPGIPAVSPSPGVGSLIFLISLKFPLFRHPSR